jgi:hypothetical protein
MASYQKLRIRLISGRVSDAGSEALHSASFSLHEANGGIPRFDLISICTPNATNDTLCAKYAKCYKV